MAAENEWTIGGLRRDAEGLSVSKALDISEERFEILHAHALFVTQMAGQREYLRVVDVAARLERTLDSARAELAEGAITVGTEAAIALDFVAVVHAGDRLERSHLAQIRAEPSLTTSERRTFTEFRHRVRATPEWLIAHRLAGESILAVFLDDDKVYFEQSRSRPVRDLARAVVGQLFQLERAFMGAFRSRFEAAATELEAAITAVDDGSPSLIAYVMDGGVPKNLRVVGLPVPELHALHHFHEASVQSPEEMVSVSITVAESSTRSDVTIGDVDVSAAAAAIVAGTAVNTLPSSTFELDLTLIGSAPLDYWGEVRYGVTSDGGSETLFEGTVRTVRPNDTVVSVECEGALESTEHNARGMLAAGVEGGELVQSILAQAGLRADSLPLESSPEPGREESFEVMVPVRGFEVHDAISIGDTTIEPISRADLAFEGFNADDARTSALAAEFRDATSYARAEVVATALHTAEDAGLLAITTAFAWLTVWTRYGFARLPDGRPLSFTRHEALRSPLTGPRLVVHGV